MLTNRPQARMASSIAATWEDPLWGNSVAQVRNLDGHAREHPLSRGTG
jgi:hypothetical protein